MPSTKRREKGNVMACWRDNARFNVFAKCDVFIEDDHYLYVENQAFDYNGSYICREYRAVKQCDKTNAYIYADFCGGSNEYITGLEVAPWEIARDIIECELARWQKIEEEYDKEREEGEEQAHIVHEARWCLMHYANPNEVFCY